MMLALRGHETTPEAVPITWQRLESVPQRPRKNGESSTFCSSRKATAQLTPQARAIFGNNCSWGHSPS